MFGSLTNLEGSLVGDLGRMQHEMEGMYGPRVWQAGIRPVARGTYPPINVGANIVATDFLSATDRLSSRAIARPAPRCAQADRERVRHRQG
jgi:HSP20 family protein